MDNKNLKNIVKQTKSIQQQLKEEVESIHQFEGKGSMQAFMLEIRLLALLDEFKNLSSNLDENLRYYDNI